MIYIIFYVIKNDYMLISFTLRRTMDGNVYLKKSLNTIIRL